MDDHIGEGRASSPTPPDRNPWRSSWISTQVDEERARLETGPRRDAAGRVNGPVTRAVAGFFAAGREIPRRTSMASPAASLSVLAKGRLRKPD